MDSQIIWTTTIAFIGFYWNRYMPCADRHIYSIKFRYGYYINDVFIYVRVSVYVHLCVS